MSIELSDAEQLYNVGEINSERGLQAKRNLFVFTATILIIHYNGAIDFSDLTLFGLSPFGDNSQSSFFWLMIVGGYLFIYWAYHYLQGWSEWRTRFDNAFLRYPLRLLFWMEWTRPKDGSKIETSYLEKNSEDYRLIDSVKNREGDVTNSERRAVRFNAAWFIRRQLVVFFAGVLVLFFMSYKAINILWDNYKTPIIVTEQM